MSSPNLSSTSSTAHSQHSQYSQHRPQGPLRSKRTGRYVKFLAAKSCNTFFKRASLISIFVLAIMILTDILINQGSCLKTFLKNPMKMNHFIKNPFTITVGVTAVSLLGYAISTKDKIVKYKEYQASINYDGNLETFVDFDNSL